MPVFTYFAVVGPVLVALLFVADATLEKSGPMPFNNESVGIPKAWHPDGPPQTKTAILTATPAPAPDMTSEAVRAAAPPAPHLAEMTEAAAAVAQADTLPEQRAKLDTAPKKKRVARRQPREDDDSRSYAWSSSRNGNDNNFFGGGNSMFGRF